MAPKLAVVVPIAILALLGAAVCQSPPANPPGLNPSSLNMISYPPSQSPSSSTPPTYSSTQSPLSSNPLAYAPSPSQPTSSQPVAGPTTYAPTTSPALSPSPIPQTYPPSVSPSPSISTTPTYASPNLGPSSSISVPPTHPPSPTPSPMPPTYPPSTSPSPSISSPPTYPSPSPSLSSSIAITPTHPPSPIPSLIPPTYPRSPSPSISSPPTYPSPSSSSSSSISIPPSYPPILSPGPSPSSAPSGLSVGYYTYSCPKAETIVSMAVKTAIASNRGTGAGLIRLFFHDCFVQGCDASVLLNTTGSTEPTERSSSPNLSLRGFEVIDAAKAALEAACPAVVSCADIVAFAGRDATFFLSGNKKVYFDMPAGRYDGRVSLDSEAVANLPPPFASLQQLKDIFAAKELNTDDMVTLSGAHTVGCSHCSSFSDRLPPNASDMNATLSANLTSQCNNGNSSTTVPQDFVTPDDLDTQYYRNVLNHEVIFASDAALLASNQTADMVSANAFTPGLWENKFKAAMVKMGRVGVKTSTDGEIRKKCWMVN